MKYDNLAVQEKFASECGLSLKEFQAVASLSICLLMENQPLMKNFILPNIKQAIKEGLI